MHKGTHSPTITTWQDFYVLAHHLAISSNRQVPLLSQLTRGSNEGGRRAFGMSIRSTAIVVPDGLCAVSRRTCQPRAAAAHRIRSLQTPPRMIALAPQHTPWPVVPHRSAGRRHAQGRASSQRGFRTAESSKRADSATRQTGLVSGTFADWARTKPASWYLPPSIARQGAAELL